MNGTEASRMWSEFAEHSSRGDGFHAVKSVPGLFYHNEWKATLSCHGDDFLAEGEAQDLDKVDAMMMRNFEVKILPRIGPEEFGGHGSHLHRVIRWTGKGFSCEADNKCAKIIVEALGLKNAKGVDAARKPAETIDKLMNC